MRSRATAVAWVSLPQASAPLAWRRADVGAWPARRRQGRPREQARRASDARPERRGRKEERNRLGRIASTKRVRGTFDHARASLAPLLGGNIPAEGGRRSLARDKRMPFERRRATWHSILSLTNLTMVLCCAFPLLLGHRFAQPGRGAHKGGCRVCGRWAVWVPPRGAACVTYPGMPAARLPGQANTLPQPGLPRRFSRRI